MTQSVWKRPHTTCVTCRPCSGLMERGLTQPRSARSPCPHCPSPFSPHVITSSGVSATVCSALRAAATPVMGTQHTRVLMGSLAASLLS